MLTCFAGCSQICAVLAAVTEVIRSRGGKESETEYFAALVSAACVEEGSCCWQHGWALRRDGERCCACSQGPECPCSAEMLLGCSWFLFLLPKGWGRAGLV